MKAQHGSGCGCHSCEMERRHDMRSELQGLAYENNGSGHPSGCVCDHCSRWKEKRVTDIVDRYWR